MCLYKVWGGASFDHLAVYVDGVELARLEGKTDYSPVGWTKPIAVSNDWLIAKGLGRVLGCHSPLARVFSK